MLPPTSRLARTTTSLLGVAAVMLTSVVLGTGSAAAGPATGTGTGYLSTSGASIVDANGDVVRLTGLNWFGNETGSRTFDGLWSERSYQDQIDQMASLGYNTLRVPWSNDILEPDSRPTNLNRSANSDLADLTSLEVLDTVIHYAGSQGMRVILDRHRPTSEATSALWYTDEVPEEQWIQDWQTIARRYAGNPVVVGADLHNEPRADGSYSAPTGSCWGCGDPARDWRLAAERAGNAVHEVNPDLLIVVEGVSCPSGGTPGPGEIDRVQGTAPCGWWGGNLSQAGRFPVRLHVPDKLVYSPHDYGMSVYAEQPWFLDDAFPATLEPFWRQQWGYLAEHGTAPVLLGEFGSTLEDPKDQVWMPQLLDYLDQIGASFMYWSWNPNSDDTGGMVENDWATVETAKQAIVQPHLVAPVPGEANPAPAPTPRPTPTSPTTPPTSSPPPGPSEPPTGACTAEYAVVNSWPGGFQAQVTVTATSALTGWSVEWATEADVQNAWNGALTVQDGTANGTNAAWNSTLAAGSTAQLGFVASGPSAAGEIACVGR